MLLATYLSEQIVIDETGKVVLEEETLRTYEEKPESVEYLFSCADLPEPWSSLLTEDALEYVTYETDASLSSSEIKKLSFIEKHLSLSKEKFKNGEKVQLKDLHNFSATNFRAGRTNMMKEVLLPVMAARWDFLFQPKMLSSILTQDFNFFEYADNNKLRTEYWVKPEVKLKWQESKFTDGSIAFKPLIQKQNGSWEPAHFIEPRKKMLKYQKTVDDDILSLIAKRAIVVLGTIDSKPALDYAQVISQVHVVLELRFNDLARCYKERVRSCLDNIIMNSIADELRFVMHTGSDVAARAENAQSAISLDNKSSFYSTILGPKASPFLVFQWRNLLCTYLTPVFGLCLAPAINQTVMILFSEILDKFLSETDMWKCIDQTSIWIDDFILVASTNMRIIKSGEISPFMSVLWLAYALSGITINVRKSALTHEEEIQYLGLKINFSHRPVSFKVLPDQINKILYKLLTIFDLTEGKIFDQLLEHKHSAKPFSSVLPEGQIVALKNKFKFRCRTDPGPLFRNLQQLQGTLMWINNNFELKAAIWPLLLLSRYDKLLKNPFLTDLVVQILLDTPFLMSPLIQKYNSDPVATLTYFLEPCWGLEKFSYKRSWQGILPLSHAGIYEVQEHAGDGFTDKRGVKTINPNQLNTIITVLYSKLEKLIDFSDFQSWEPRTFSSQGKIVNLKIYVVSNVLRAEARKMTKLHISYLKVLDKFQWDLERKLPVAVKYDFIAKNRPAASNSKKAFFPLKDLENHSFLFPIKELAVMQIHPIYLDIPTLQGFGQLEQENPGFLGDLNDLSTRAHFWDILKSKNVKTFLVNTTDLTCNRFFLEKLDSKPPGITILWYFRSQKLQRGALRHLKKFKTQFVSFPSNLFIDQFNILISTYSHVYASDLMAHAANRLDDVIELLSIY